MGEKREHGPDDRWRDLRVEVKSETHGFRNLRASLLELAYWLADHPNNRALLVLLDSRITDRRLQDERKLAARAIRSELMRRLIIASGCEGRYMGLPQDLGEEFKSWLDRYVSNKSPRCKPRESFYAILQILLHQWLLGEEPPTRKALGEMADCSYPTVAAALRRLDPYLMQSKRRVELKYFPRDEWTRLLAVSDHVRETTRYAVLSGEPSSPKAHLRRLEKLKMENIAIGGVLGARHYHPDLDLVGTPRLDLSLHCSGKNIDLGFIQKLDPALRPAASTLQPANFVIHVVRRAESYFAPRQGGLQWADPVECLLDLHEARLESQAKDFLRALEARRQKARSLLAFARRPDHRSPDQGH